MYHWACVYVPILAQIQCVQTISMNLNNIFWKGLPWQKEVVLLNVLGYADVGADWRVVLSLFWALRFYVDCADVK